MPKEYIDREAAVKAVYQYLLEQTVSKYATSELCIEARGAISRAMEVLDDVPAADVAPVVHSEWEWYEKWIPSTTEHPAECQAFGRRCGNCKRDAQDMGFGYWDDPTEKPLMIYCPVCGAKMDGGNK